MNYFKIEVKNNEILTLSNIYKNLLAIFFCFFVSNKIKFINKKNILQTEKFRKSSFFKNLIRLFQPTRAIMIYFYLLR